MRNHDMHCRKLEPRQHCHNVAPALAFDHALLAGQDSATKPCRRLAAAGRELEVQEAHGVCHIIVAHLGHINYPMVLSPLPQSSSFAIVSSEICSTCKPLGCVMREACAADRL